MKSCLIRPGFLPPSIRGKLNIPEKEFIVVNNSANVLPKAHTYTANLSAAYVRMVVLARYVEFSITPAFTSVEASAPISGDMFASCTLAFSTPTK